VIRSNKMLLPLLAVVGIVAAYWFLVLAPKRDEIAKLDADIATQEAAATQAEQQVTLYTKAKDDYRVNYETVARLGKAVPADDDVRSLLVQLNSAAKRSKVDFKSIGLTSGASPTAATGTPGELAPAPGSVPVGSAGFSAMPFTFSFSGNYFGLSGFFQRLERFVTVQNDNIDVTGRLLLLGSISVTPDTADPRKLQAQIGATTYLVPPTQGVQGAEATTAAGSAAAQTDGGTASTPTASITGVR
jgi:hypothetical protein